MNRLKLKDARIGDVVESDQLSDNQVIGCIHNDRVYFSSKKGGSSCSLHGTHFVCSVDDEGYLYGDGHNGELFLIRHSIPMGHPRLIRKALTK